MGDKLLNFRKKLYEKVLEPSEIRWWLGGEPAINCFQCHKYPSSVKCCTYEPLIPNFLVGAWLEHQKIKPSDLDHALYQPIGRLPNPTLKAQLLASPDKFGTHELAVCSFFQNERCSVWPLNGARCMTYFCESSRGQEGLSQWEVISHKCLDHELRLAQELMVACGFPGQIWDNQLKSIELSQVDLMPSNWYLYFGGGKAQYYKHCYHKVTEFLDQPGTKRSLRAGDPDGSLCEN